MVGENTHLTRVGGDVDLDDILGAVDGLRLRQLAPNPSIGFLRRMQHAIVCRRLGRGSIHLGGHRGRTW